MSTYFYLNDTSRGIIKSDITLLSRECKIIYDLKEMEENSVFICTELCLTDSKFMSKLRLYQNLYSLDVIVLCYDLSKADLISDYARVFICDYSLVDMDMIRSAIYNEKMDGAVVQPKGIEDILKRKRTTELEQDLAQLLEQEHDVNVRLREQIASLQDQCEMAQENAACVNGVLDKMMVYYQKMVEKSKELDGSLQQYKAILTNDVYERVNAFKYKERPQVVYFKQYQYSLGMYELLKVLSDVLYHQKHKSVKVIQLMDSSCSMRLKEVPSYYKTFINSFNKTDLYRNDFICCVGGYQQILGTLLENMAKIDILIIFDTMSHEDIVLQDAMLQYGVCRTGEVARSFALGPNTLVNEDGEDSNFIRYTPLDLQENSFVHNASSDVVLRILDDIDEFSSTI